MAGTTKEQTKGQLSSKDARKNIAQQLETLLAGWKEQLGEKKFKSRIEKAAKVFSKGLPVTKKAAPAPGKKAAKPAGVKNVKTKTPAKKTAKPAGIKNVKTKATAKKAAATKAAAKAPRGANNK